MNQLLRSWLHFVVNSIQIFGERCDDFMDKCLHLFEQYSAVCTIVIVGLYVGMMATIVHYGKISWFELSIAFGGIALLIAGMFAAFATMVSIVYLVTHLLAKRHRQLLWLYRFDPYPDQGLLLQFSVGLVFAPTVLTLGVILFMNTHHVDMFIIAGLFVATGLLFAAMTYHFGTQLFPNLAQFHDRPGEPSS